MSWADTPEFWQAARAAACDEDRSAAEHWRFLTEEADGWNDAAIDQFIEKYCTLSEPLEKVRTRFDATMAEVCDELLRP